MDALLLGDVAGRYLVLAGLEIRGFPLRLPILVELDAFGSPDRFESVGKMLLGKESDWAFFYL